MRKEDFQQVHIDAVGNYRLVPEDVLTRLLAAASLSPTSPTFPASSSTPPTTVVASLGQLVRIHRSARDWSQDRLAAEAEISRKTVWNIEEGGDAQRLPHEKTLLGLCSALGPIFEGELRKLVPGLPMKS